MTVSYHAITRFQHRDVGWAPRDEKRGAIGGAEGAGDPQKGTPYALPG